MSNSHIKLDIKEEPEKYSCNIKIQRCALVLIIIIIVGSIIGLGGLTGSWILPNAPTAAQWGLGIVINFLFLLGLAFSLLIVGFIFLLFISTIRWVLGVDSTDTFITNICWY